MASIHKRRWSKSSPWCYYVSFRHDGKQRSVRAGNRRREAEVLKTRIEHELHRGTYQEPTNMTFEELAERFLAAVRPNVREKTFVNYQGHLRRIAVFFGPRRIRSIHPMDCEEFRAHLAVAGMSPATAGKHIRTLKMVLKRAVEWDLIAKNPAEHVKLPRAARTEPDFLTSAEMARLIAATDERHRCFIMTACYTGMRLSELLGLCWDSVDFAGSRLFVKRSLQDRNFCEPKTATSRRSVVIPPSLVEALKIHEARTAVDLPENPHNLVFTSEIGGMLDPANIRNRVFWPALRRAGLRRVRFHDLRHSAIAAMISRGENVKFIQRQAGHASITQTLGTYGHLLAEVEDEAPTRLEAVFASGEAANRLTAAS